jgi:hypothetical protein
MTKKHASRHDRLAFHTESVRELVSTELDSVVGGTYMPTCTANCPPLPPLDCLPNPWPC